jgi:ATP-dependent DNA helicase PIF1
MELAELPVYAMDGRLYSLEAIDKWLASHGTSPVTRSPLPRIYLRPTELVEGYLSFCKSKGMDLATLPPLPVGTITRTPDAARHRPPVRRRLSDELYEGELTVEENPEANALRALFHERMARFARLASTPELDGVTSLLSSSSSSSSAQRITTAPAPSRVSPAQHVSRPLHRTLAEMTPAYMGLNTLQLAVYTAVQSGQSVFYTGCAGTGKSYLLKAIVSSLPPGTTWVTATTGVAALNIRGRTIHSRAGIGLGRKSAQALVRDMNSSHRSAWRSCTTLIIDEISMLSRELFEKLDEIARTIRNSTQPFGGIQLVLSGDFYQLAPVSKESEGAASRQFCFESPLWSRAVPVCIELTHIYRQTDEALVKLLKEVRNGQLSASSIETLKGLERPLPVREGVTATRLFSTNTQVDVINDNNLNQIEGEAVVYTAEDETVTSEGAAQLERQCIAPPRLTLKKGAQVMFLRNLGDNVHVNGSRGVVVGFHPVTKIPQVRFLNGTLLDIEPHVWVYESHTGECIAARKQIPLRLAWAITVHKSQGLTIDHLEVDLQGTFATGQAYVALSRARSLSGLRVLHFHPRYIRTNPTVQAMFSSLGQPPREP